ncbi:cell wall-binding repeat-containing protein [Micromonospora inositola]|uniref:WD40-like Beta Propeller Repeat n=1 Tax=Micromonospora inositola TaxID=47865 RepID=A0A1C5I6K1_9ACTN|nr:cell wall-binding repeat-containing protein [Micromonospora inositola]SCG53576.1 WD40-like Beta Propeller Repeat [Micromonospora inositola]
MLAVAAAAVVVGAGRAHATHQATNYALTASNGTNTISWGAASQLTDPDHTITDAAWSPDGSRAVFVTGDGGIGTIRWSGSGTFMPIADPEPGVRRAGPKWVGNGTTIVWAAKSATGRWRIEQTVSGYGGAITTVSPDDGYHYLDVDTNDFSRIVVERQADDGAGNPVGPSEIGYLDDGAWTRITTDAASPALAPIGNRVAFVRGGQIWACDFSGGNLVQLTANATTHTDPAYSPDARLVAFGQDGRVAEAAWDGSNADNPSVPPWLSGLSGVPAYRPDKIERVVRLAGEDRFTTARAISQSHWATIDLADDRRIRANAVVVTRSDTFADALAGSALAAAKQGPLLMNPPDRIDSWNLAEIARVLPRGGTVYLLGSEAALGPDVEDNIVAWGFKVVRLAGPDRFATAVEIAKAIDPTPDLVLAATGMNFPDALAAGAAAGSRNLPGRDSSAVVVLTNDGKLPPATKSFLDGLPDTSEIVGVGRQGAEATSGYGSIPLYGADRYDTARALARTYFQPGTRLGLATGTNWPDALAGGALMGTIDGPLLLTPGTAAALAPQAREIAEQRSGSVHTGVVFGSAAVVTDSQAAQFAYAYGGANIWRRMVNPYDVGISPTT